MAGWLRWWPWISGISCRFLEASGLGLSLWAVPRLTLNGFIIYSGSPLILRHTLWLYDFGYRQRIINGSWQNLSLPNIDQSQIRSFQGCPETFMRDQPRQFQTDIWQSQLWTARGNTRSGLCAERAAAGWLILAEGFYGTRQTARSNEPNRVQTAQISQTFDARRTPICVCYSHRRINSSWRFASRGEIFWGNYANI